VDRDANWTVRRDTLVGRSANTPLLGRTLRGAVQLTMLHGSVAWQAGTTS
jgi:dihydroorotase-like cyclic amidohydrolase